MKISLGEFQDAFARGLYGTGTDAESHSSPLAALFAQPGFAIYRNNVIKACIDAVQANFPSVERLVGTEWFRAAAAIYVRSAPPVDTRLMYYGADFPAFLARFEPARAMPYLTAVARLDQLWMEVHAAADQAPLELAALAALAPAALGQAKLPVRAAARWQWFPEQAAYTIWRCNREAAALPDTLDWTGEGALLTRPHGAVQWRPLSRGACAFLDACAAGLALDEAAGQALEAEPALDFMTLLQDLIAAGAFAALAAHPD